MKTFNISLLTSFLMIMASCANEVDDIANPQEAPLGKNATLSRSYDAANPGIAYFDSISTPELWIQYKTLDEKQAALNLPSNLMEELSTDQLAECCIYYPLSINSMAYNDTDLGVRHVIEGFNGYSELLSRPDYAESLIRAYGILSLNYASSLATKEKSQSSISLKLDKIFCENLLASGFFPEVLEGTNAQQLLSIQTQNLISKKEAEKDYFALVSFEKLQNKINGTGNTSSVRSRQLSYIYTLYGKAIEVFDRIEMPEESKQGYIDRMREEYPNAELLGPPSYTYNCHYYAWAMRDNPTPHWMNFKNSDGGNNVSRYWTTDEYTEGSADNCINIYYCDSDHSARISSVKGKFESKWGPGCLMRHDPLDCPYKNSDLIYYKRAYYGGPLYTSYGYGETTVGSKDSYYINAKIPSQGIRFNWTIETAKGDDAVENGRAIIHSTGYGQAVIEFTQPGLYELTVRGYNSKDEEVVNFGFEPIVNA